MKRTKRFLAFVLAACMIFGMLPALSASAEEGEAASSNFMEVVGSGTSSYLSTVGSNAFNVLMYNNTFSGVFGDQHMGGIELSLNGMRIATNGDLHMLPTPEQWDATPAPSRGTPVLDQANGAITIPMTFSGSPDGVLKYDLVAKSIDGGVCMEMILRSEMPADLIGKARFNLEFRPASYRNKSYQADLNADGVYDSFGVFPLHPQDEMIETERPNLPSQTWYVKEWNVDRGNDQPAPFATAYGFAFSPEDEETAIDIEAANGDLLELYDGRNRAQNGWYVLSTIISATKPGDVAIAWNIRPHVKEGWVRDPNVGFSQVGYSPYQEKFAVVELDKWDNNYPKTMALYRVNADGSEEVVCEKELGETTNWMRFKYARFDFTEVTEVGLYRIHYGDYVGEVFPISKEVYDNIWQTCLSGFMAVQMDHISVREGYKIWHGAAHMDDLSFGPAGTSYFDGQSTPAQLPASVRAKGHTELVHIDGMNKGGWFDAGDFDIQTARNTQVLGYFIDAAESWDNMNGYDDLTVVWDDATGGTVEMHRPDGVPDVVQQVVHGAKQIIAQYDILGVIGGTVEVRTLRQYTHLGDPSSDTDGWIYDPELGPGDVVERDGKVYSGVPDDRYMMLGGGGGGGSFFSNATSFAATAYIAAPYYPEFAQYAMKAANDVWYNEHMSAAPTVSGEWNQLVQFTLATKRLEELGISYLHDDELNYAYYKERLDQLADEAVSGGISNRVNCLYIMDIMDDDYRAKCAEAAEKVADSLTLNTQPYGVNFTSGSGWGASPNTYSGVRNISMIYHFFPNEKFKTNILRSVDYLLGRHPATNSSWISGIGTKSMLHPYNSNRAEESYIPGSILPGHITFGDYVESMDDFNFLWFENESIINYQSSWLPVGIAAGQIAHDEEEAPVAETKDFTSSFDAELVTKTSTSMWGGGSSNYYFSDDGFNMIMYATTFDRTFGDQHCAGIELIQNGRRIATNGDIHLLPTPEQWDATPPPTKGTVTAEGNTVTVPMTIPAETFDDGTENPAVAYRLIAEPEEGGIKLTVQLDEPLPADLAGKAGFNLEFLPAVFIGKSYQTDSDGDGVYDDFGVFPQDPR
ncbi:MAG: glycoside hydrolase family 9 protein, partial [Oscillospiraceae bacterium]|nr:glycoside hydrolase family 9 protein [Oscillospiraceae bacterium]